MGEVLFMVAFVAAPLILWSLFLTGKGRIYWLLTMSGCLGTVLVFELVSKLSTGSSISQHFWHWSELHPMTAVITLGFMFFGWVMLLIHLAWRLIAKSLYKEPESDD